MVGKNLPVERVHIVGLSCVWSGGSASRHLKLCELGRVGLLKDPKHVPNVDHVHQDTLLASPSAFLVVNDDLCDIGESSVVEADTAGIR
jgi:hypothetical protein